jgi:hypothetical protein
MWFVRRANRIGIENLIHIRTSYATLFGEKESIKADVKPIVRFAAYRSGIHNLQSTL